MESGWSAILASNPELRSVVSAAERYIPFVLIVCIKSVFEHGTGIIVCLGLILTFLHANSVVKQQVRTADLGLDIARSLGVEMLTTGRCRVREEETWELFSP